jgi:curved DNA-binding protein
MQYRDYYDILGLSKDAGERDVKRAFRGLARKYHPDVNPGDPKAEERFKEINEAYEVLSDPEKRKKYDQLGSDWARWQQTGGRAGDFDWSRWTTGGGPGAGVHVRYGRPEDFEGLFGGAGTFSDFFTQIFGGAARRAGDASGGFRFRSRPSRGQDFQQEVQISLREAYSGTTRVLQKDGRRLEVRIPPGARSGTRVRVSGQGGPGPSGGAPGDLYLRVSVEPDQQYDRQGDDLHVTVAVELYTAVLGGKTTVPTFSGQVSLAIPPGTQNGQTFRLRGQGMPRIKKPSERGDLFAEVDVLVPEHLSQREKDLFEELRRLSGGR